MGNGSDAVLFRLWKGKTTAFYNKNVIKSIIHICSFFFVQCPFHDEYILGLHEKIRTAQVEFPDM